MKSFVQTALRAAVLAAWASGTVAAVRAASTEELQHTPSATSKASKAPVVPVAPVVPAASIAPTAPAAPMVLAAAPPAPAASQPQQAPAPRVLAAKAQQGNAFPDVLGMVLSRDPEVVSAREALNVAIAGAKQTRSRFFPSLGINSNVGRSQQTSVNLPKPYNQTNNRTEGVLRWNLFNGFADSMQMSADEHDRLAAVADLQRALDDTCQRTLETYFDWLRLQQQLDSAELRVSEVAVLSNRVQRQFAGGKVSEGDAQLAASSLIDAQFSRDSLRADVATARAKTETLAGAALTRPLPWALPATAGLDAGFGLPLDDAVAQARLGNGQWRASLERAEAARSRVGIVAPDYLPKLDLDVRRRLNDRTNPANDPTTKKSWGVQLTYEVPLGGAIGARQDELRARANGAMAEADRVEQAVRGDLAAARFRSQQAQEALDPVARQVKYLQDVVRTGEIQYEAGRRSLQQLIQLRDQRYNVEQRSADNSYRMLTSQSRWLSTSGMLATTLGVAVPEDARQPVKAK